MRTIEKIIQENFDKVWLWFAEEIPFFGNRIFGKNREKGAPNDAK